MVGAAGSFTCQSCPGDIYGPLEPSSSPLGHSQVALDPLWPQNGAARQPWLRLLGHAPAKAVAVESTLSRNIPAQCGGQVHWLQQPLSPSPSAVLVHCCAQQCGGQVKSTVCTAVRAHGRGRGREGPAAANFCQFCPAAPGQKRFWPFLWPLAFKRPKWLAINHLLSMLNILVYHMS